MFYSHDILQKRGGKFGIIWIAATKAVSLTKRDYFSVSVTKTCDDILMYIAHQYDPRSPKPRLSLYLSSQLMFGVVRVFEKQYDYLTVEVRDLHRRFSMAKLSARVFQGMPVADIELPRRVPRTVDACTLPEPKLDQFDTEIVRLEGGLEPFLLPTIEMFSLSPTRTEPLSSSSPQATPNRKRKLEDEFAQTIGSPDEITLKEDVTMMTSPRAQEIEIPGDQDLPIMEEDGRFEQLLQDTQPTELPIEQQDIGVISPLRTDQVWTMDDKTGEVVLSPVASKPGKTRAKQRKKTKEQKEKALESESISPMVSDVEGMERILLSDHGGLDVVPVEERPEMQTPKAPAVIPILRLAPIEEPETLSPLRQERRRRRLVFADEVLKLSKDDLRHNMSTYNDLMLRDDQRIPVPTRQLTVKEMFELPARKALRLNHEFMTKIWKQQAVRYESSEASFSDEEKRPVWSTAYLRERTAISTDSSGSQEKSPEELRQGPGDLSTEVLRDVSVHSAIGRRQQFEDTPVSLTVLSDVSHLSEDKSRGSSVNVSAIRTQRQQHVQEDLIEEEDREIQDNIVMDMGHVLLDGLMAEDVIAQTEESHVPALDDLHDLMESQRKSWKEPEHSTSEEEGTVPHGSVFKQISDLIEDMDEVTFQDLVPLTTYRQVATKIFNVCLEYGAMQLIRMEQDTAYSTITIHKGMKYDDAM